MARQDKGRRLASPALLAFLRVVVGRPIRALYKLGAENRELLDTLTPPYIILSNHVSNWDPVFISFFCNHPVHHVASDAQFRSPFMEKLLTILGAIPKTKSRSDMETVKRIFQIRDKNGVICVFPEGQRTWNGATLPLLYPTAKLLKTIKIPVITARIRGAYLFAPRWGRSRRRGKISIRFDMGFTRDDLKELDPDEIYRKLTGLLDYNEFTRQREVKTAFKGKNGAEYLERALFFCPGCGSLNSLRSDNRRLTCTACNYGVEFGPEGFFSPANPEEKLVFDNLYDWDRWQITRFREILAEAKKENKAEAVFTSPVDLYTGAGRGNLRRKCRERGEAAFYLDRITLSCAGGKELVFPLNEVSAVNVQTGEHLEFHQGSTLYRFQFRDPRVSGYQWLMAIELSRPEN